jgi:AbrB family looped-hinge helix DNA binding protein
MSDAIKATIDKAGRVVIPASVRQRAGLTPGSVLEVRLEETGVRLVRAVPGPELVEVKGRLVARPRVPRESLPIVDVARLVEEERDRWP